MSQVPAIVSSEEAPEAGPRNRRLPAGGGAMQPPMVPMIDVTFQLLIFFILTAQFRMNEGQIAGTVPEIGDEENRPVISNIQSVRVVIRRPMQEGAEAVFEVAGIQLVGGEKLFQNLFQRLARAGADKDQVPLEIQPEADAPWEYVVEAFNQGVRAEFQKIRFQRPGAS